jgi:hypothetical protein
VIISLHVQNHHNFIGQVIIPFIFLIDTALSSANQLESIIELINERNDEYIAMTQEKKKATKSLNNNLFRLKADYNAAVTFYDDDDIDYIA